MRNPSAECLKIFRVSYKQDEGYTRVPVDLSLPSPQGTKGLGVENRKIHWTKFDSRDSVREDGCL